MSRHDFVAGNFSQHGVSGVDRLGVITEIYRIQIQLGANPYLQFIILFLRLLKNSGK